MERIFWSSFPGLRSLVMTNVGKSEFGGLLEVVEGLALHGKEQRRKVDLLVLFLLSPAYSLASAPIRCPGWEIPNFDTKRLK